MYVKLNPLAAQTITGASSLTLIRDGELNFRLKAFGTSAFPIISTTRALGTQASPLAVTSGKELMVFQANGQTGAGSSRTGGSIDFVANENWDISNSGTRLIFKVVKDGTTSASEHFRVVNGNVQLPDNVNLAFGSNTGGDVALDFDAASTSNLVLGRVTGTPDFQIDMPLIVMSAGDETSRFGFTPTILAGTDTADTFISAKEKTGTGLRRGGLFVAEYTADDGGSDSGLLMGLNSFAYTSIASTGNLTGPSTGGRYATRHHGAGTMTRGAGIQSQAFIGGSSGGTMTTGIAFLAEGNNGGSSTGEMTTSYGLWVMNGLGNIVNQYGIRIDEQTAGSTLNNAIFLGGAGGIFLRNQDLNIFSSADGTLNIFADVSVDINSHVVIDKNITAFGDLTFVGTGSGLAAGGIFFDGGLNGASTFDIITTNTGEANMVQITGFDSDTNANNVSFNSDSNSITILVTGNYWVAINFSSSSSQANDYETVVYRNNGTIDTQIHAHRTTSTAGRIANFGDTGIVFFNAGDTVEAWLVRNNGGAVSRTMTFEHADLSVFQLGG